MKQARLLQVKSKIADMGFQVHSEDLDRPWGGFFVIDPSHTDIFIDRFFPEHKERLAKGGQVSPKFLVVEPGKRLSWQVHERRAEVWRVVEGPVGAFVSESDEHPESHIHLEVSEVLEMGQGIRHRLIGLEDWGVVAEIWVHTDENLLSDEDDIRRISDDFKR